MMQSEHRIPQTAHSHLSEHPTAPSEAELEVTSQQNKARLSLD